MKKTVNINLGGVIFHIDEDAFEQLNAYLSRIKSHYNQEDGCEEIASDIEARIAELLQEKNIQIISSSDVSTIIAIMGEPESYEEDETEEPASKSENSFANKKAKKRIYRDKDNEVIGGVCSGIAAYFDIDPVVIRLLALVGMFAGGGVIVYFILWAIIPEAKTTAQKLQMKGEKVNAENIKKTIQKEFEELKSTVENIDAKDQKDKVKNIFQKIIRFVLSLVGYLFKFIGKFIGIILFIMGVSLCFMIVANIFGSSSGIIHINGNNINPLNLNQFFPLLFDTSKFGNLSLFGMALFIGIPVIQIIWLSVRILFSIPKQSATTRTIMACLWVIGIISMTYVGSQKATSFKVNASTTTTTVIESTSDTLNIGLAENEYFNTHQKSSSYHFDEELESLLATDIRLKIEKSTSENFELEIRKIASGESQKQAKINAGKMDYHYSIEEDELNLDNYFSLAQGEGFRFQEMELTLYVPKGKTVYLYNSTKYMIYDVDNNLDMYDDYMVNHHWEMSNYELNCTDCD